jgi:hypothetical protein
MSFSLSGLLRTTPLFLIVAIALCLDGPGLLPAEEGQKPMFPVRSTLSLSGVSGPGGTAQVLATVTSWTDEEIAWRLEVPAGVQVVAGPENWAGILGTGESRTFEITLAGPGEAPYEVTAVVQIDLGRPDGFKASGRLVTGDGTDHLEYRGTVHPR